MSAALIALSGVVIGGLLTWWAQRSNTKLLIAAELNKVYAQLEGDARKRLLARKQDLLIDAISALAAATDPELHAKYDYQRVVTLIHQVQLVLDPRVHADARLNQATTDLGLTIQAAAAGGRDVRSILAAQSQVIEAARQLLRPVDLLP
jgi:hypothetical protein